MKSPSFLGQMLAVCLPFIAIVVGALPSSAVAPQHAAPTPASSVTVRHKEGSRYLLSANSYPVTEVRLVLERSLPGGALLMDPRSVRAMLSRLYGTRLSESSAPMGYTWQWDGEKWVLVCSLISTFRVDFGSRGTVEVEVRTSTVVP